MKKLFLVAGFALLILASGCIGGNGNDTNSDRNGAFGGGTGSPSNGNGSGGSNSGGGSGSGESSSGSGGDSISSSWCSGNRGAIETFKGRQACHTSTLSGEVYTFIIDKDYWVIQSQAYNYEAHFVNRKCTELNCLSENPQSLAACEQFKTIYCPA
ncbi:MAG: hypothetical protein AABW99_04180 [archaeon]